MKNNNQKIDSVKQKLLIWTPVRHESVLISEVSVFKRLRMCQFRARLSTVFFIKRLFYLYLLPLE